MSWSDVGPYLKACREARKLTRARLAALLQTSEVTIWRIETNQQEPSGALLVAFINVVGADFEHIRHLVVDSPPPVAAASAQHDVAHRGVLRESPAPYDVSLADQVQQLDTEQLLEVLVTVSLLLRERHRLERSGSETNAGDEQTPAD